ncbi:hypothetical protein NQ315_005965 [Exocentrus adspersus]|uniref:Uncharacterized protein n=1 Tax=Exocentrus adspersus TaxID=1586481 RepID=A0AAV8VB89_9CUCU|nr:hypothetical protein NQ315_005965 [Exocentrus adspersus]
MGRYVQWYPNLEDYKFYPKAGNCYETYLNHNVTPLTCQEPANPDNHSCIRIITTGNEYCLGLNTPTNETIRLLCDNSEEELLNYHADAQLNTCFTISKPNRANVEVCQQTYDNYSIGITTPDNFTILFDSYFCSTSMSVKDIEKYSNFISTFSFNPETKGCYRIYNENQTISPYKCYDEEIFVSCVTEVSHNIRKGCKGITTRNNETVILQCSDKLGVGTSNCFEIYTDDNNRRTACVKKVEERCVGIVTPSNLTVLLDCYFCGNPKVEYTSYVEEQRTTYIFLKAYISDEYLGKNSHLEQTAFGISNQSSFLPETFESKVYGYWLPNSSCYGITLESNETVILQCTDTIKNKKPGCFLVSGPNEETVCIKILNDKCVGITTPLNWSVALACYTQHYKSQNELLKEYYARADYRLTTGLDFCYEVYSSKVDPHHCQKRTHPENYSCVDWIPGEKHCLGLKTPGNETIELLCAESQESALTYHAFSMVNNCFTIYGASGQRGRVCQQRFGNYSVGVTTPDNYSIIFDSYYCTTYKTPYDFQRYKEFIGNFTFDPSIRSCYKIYTPDQGIGPYTCLSDEVYTACIHTLENTNCMGITTQNNETIVLECLNRTKPENETDCFKILTSDNKIHSTCQKQVEEQCIGITTPSNLTVLFECYSCLSSKGGSLLPSYTDEYRKNYRPYVEYALYVFTQNNKALENETFLSGYRPDQDIILLDCYDEVANVCVKIINEWCVGIKTPRNWTIPFNCYKPPSGVCSIIQIPNNGPPSRM